MNKKELIEKLRMQREVLLSLYQEPNVDAEVLKSSLASVFTISGLAIDVLEEEIDKEDEW